MPSDTITVNVNLPVPTIVNVEVRNAAPGEAGTAGASAYQSYVATTADDPVLSEAAWIAAMVPPPIDANAVSVADAAEGDMIMRGPLGWITRTIDQIKTALGLGTAAYTATTDYAASGHTHAQLHDAATVSGNGITISGQQISLSIGTTAGTVAAGDHAHAGVYQPAGSYATAAQGSLADTALQPADALGLVEGSYVIVQPGITDLANAANLRTAYTAAAALTPGGNALSATNRATVILPPGKYDVGSTTFNVTTNYVDLVALAPEMGGLPLAADLDNSNGTTALSQFRPPHTLVYSTANDTNVISQTCNANMRGFGVAQLSGDSSGAYAALEISGSSSSSRSLYEQMYFWVKAPNDSGGRRYPVKYVGAAYDTWSSCIGNAYSWRHSVSGLWGCTMIDCYAGALSYVGDLSGCSTLSTAKFIRCKSIGQFQLGANPVLGSGFGSFAGCLIYGVPVYGSEFYDCESGDQSFGVGVENTGTFIRCRGGKNCFSGNLPGGYEGFFSGYAEDCVGGAGSFGGRSSGVTTGYLSGVLVRCTVTSNVESIRLQGATIRNSRINCTTSGKDGVTLLDSNSSIVDSIIEVNEAGAGAPVNASTAKNVILAGCYLNNGANHANGIGSNVTNLVTNPLNVVKGSSSIPLTNSVLTVDAKTTPVDADTAIIRDSAASSVTKALTFANLWIWIKAKIESVALTLASPTISGAAGFTGTARPTAVNVTGLPGATDLVNRNDVDARGGYWLSARLTADEAGDTNSSAYKSSAVLTLPLEVGTWEFESFEICNAGAAVVTAGSKLQLVFSGTGTFYGGGRYVASNGTSTAVTYPTTKNTTGGGTPEAGYSSANGSASVKRIGTIVVTVAGNLTVQFANAAAVVGNAPTLAMPSYIRARKVS